jgi:hypothetical protein
MGGLSVLLNNAGIGVRGNIETCTLEEWRRGFAVNVESVFLGCQIALPLMKDHQPGSIINISSIAGLIASDTMPGYNASKAAVWMLSKSIALYLRQEPLGHPQQQHPPDFHRHPDPRRDDQEHRSPQGGDHGKARAADPSQARRRAERRSQRGGLSRQRREPVHDRRGTEARRRYQRTWEDLFLPGTGEGGSREALTGGVPPLQGRV